jgi:hypothetical protein
MHEIFEIKQRLEVKQEIEYTNSFGFKHNLKTLDSKLAENVLITLNQLNND